MSVIRLLWLGAYLSLFFAAAFCSFVTFLTAARRSRSFVTFLTMSDAAST